MGKKSRRRDKRDNKERGPPSAAEDHSDEYVVRGIEGSDPSYHHFPKLLDIDPELSRMVCSGCGVARYCSEKCQREHWPLHQEQCLACQELISITPPAAAKELIKNFS